MNCLEFEERWNEILDARSEGLADLERALDAHATNCEPCRAIAARYGLLRRAIAAWTPAPALPADSERQLRRLSAWSTPRALRIARWSRIAVPLSAAAAILVLAWLGDGWRAIFPDPAQVEAPAVARVETRRPVESALERATSATIDLAIEASAPAARIGRDVLTFEEVPSSTDLPGTGSESPDRLAASAGDVFQTVGERVRPISGSARHAFSFLLGPPPGPEQPTTPRDSL